MKTASLTKSVRLLSILCAFALGQAGQAHAHPGERVEVHVDGSEVVNSGAVEIKFDLYDEKTKKMLSADDLSVTHEKLLHVFFFDPALKEFRHEHPTYTDGKWSVTTAFQVNGYYWFYAQGKIKKDGEEFAGKTRLTVKGGLQANALPPVLTDLRTAADGASQVEIKPGQIKAGIMVELQIKFSRTDGTAPVITPYLGANAHIVAVPLDGKKLLHVHPMDSADPTQMMVHVTFPAKGFYRLWIQMVDAGSLKTVPLSVLAE